MISKMLNKNYNFILSTFPKTTAYCFAYGSGVKQQTGYDEAALQNSLIDLMFCVDDPLAWHTENLSRNPSHYSGVKMLGSRLISTIQREIGAKVYCNTLVRLENGAAIKYGVIATDDLVADLIDWTHLYVAGRLHKPVETLISANPLIHQAIERNFRNALCTALLLLPSKFTFFDLFYTIANLSYSGDFRMIFGENKDKVRNIVQPQLQAFCDLYAPVLREYSTCVQVPGSLDGFLHQNNAEDVVIGHLRALPRSVQSRLVDPKKDDAFNELAKDLELKTKLAKCVAGIVWNSSVTQSLKNIPTAGISKALRYSWKKALKTFSK